MIRIEPHQRRQIESHGEAVLTLTEQILESLVCIRRRAEARKLAHRPKLSAIARRMNSARVGILAGKSELGLVIEVGKVVRRIEPFNGCQRDGRELFAALGHALERGLESLLFPLLL